VIKSSKKQPNFYRNVLFNLNWLVEISHHQKTPGQEIDMQVPKSPKFNLILS